MGVRFNKRIKVLPWVTANVGKSGVSLTIGPKGKTLNIGSTGVNVNVSLGKGMGYSKRLITWKKLNLLGWLGIGGTAAASATKGKGKTTKGKNGNKGDAPAKPATDGNKRISLDEAIAEAELQQNATPDNDAIQTTDTAGQQPSVTSQLQEQAGCGPVGCALGVVAAVIIIALIAAVVYLLIRLNGQTMPTP